MKALYPGNNSLTLEDGHDYDLVIPDDIDKLGNQCTSRVPDKIRNIIVGDNTTGYVGYPNDPMTSPSEYSFNNLTKANVIYSGSDTGAPWGAKSLNGVDAQYIPFLMGSFDNMQVSISICVTIRQSSVQSCANIPSNISYRLPKSLF